MGVRNIKKQLAGVEDLLLGEGTQVQERNSGSVPITKINLVGIVDTVEALVTLDITKYTTAIVKDPDRGGTFIWSATGTANGGTVFAGATGYWNRQYSGAVNVKWFGAVGDGITDDTVAIKSAVLYTQSLCGLVYSQPPYKSAILIAEPNTTYYVSGDNILGVLTQDTGNGLSYNFNGNNCIFLWKPINTSDSFINNARRLYASNFYDFKVVLTGVTGTYGIFFNHSAGATVCYDINFKNVKILSGVTNSSIQYDKIFNILGTSLGAHITCTNSTFNGFLTFWYSRNPESCTNIFIKNSIVGYDINSCLYDRVGYSGGDVFENNDFGFKEISSSNGVIRCYDSLISTTDTSYISGKTAFINNRIEYNSSSNSSSVFIKANKASLIWDGGDFQTARTVVISSSEVFADISGYANLVIKNTTIPYSLNVGIFTTASTTTGLENAYSAIVIDNVNAASQNDFIINYYPMTTGVKYTDYKTALSSGNRLRQVIINYSNPHKNNTVYGNYSSKNNVYTGRLFKGTNSGYTYLNATSFGAMTFSNLVLPSNAVITKMVLTTSAVSGSVADTIRLNIGTSFSLSCTVSPTVRTKTDMLSSYTYGLSTNQADVSERTITVDNLIGGVVQSAQPIVGYIHIEYFNIYGISHFIGADITKCQVL